MERHLLSVLILITVSTLSAKHILVRVVKTWPNAQEHCRAHYTDLSPVSNDMEYTVFERFYRNHLGIEGWIGLHKDSNSPTGWKWSGGANSLYRYNKVENPYVYWNRNGWLKSSDGTYYFFCFNLMVDEVRKTWEEALEHCRDHHTELTSLHSETETLLALKEIQLSHITERVWIGLRFFGDHWLWVDGDPLVYEAWKKGGDQDHQCPLQKRCGALTKQGHWENWDCEEKLNFICY